MLTIYDDDERIFNVLCAGACGYLLKKTPPVRLHAAPFPATSPEMARRAITLFSVIRPSGHADCDLSPHEIRLLKMLVQGHNDKTAALEFGVTVYAIFFHMRNIYEKIQVHSKS